MSVESEVQQWLERVVIGLELCPFAQHPYQQGQVHIEVTQTEREEVLLQTLMEAMQALLEDAQRETTLVVASRLFEDFGDYNQFLDYVDALIEQSDWQGVFQVATFHPDYQFADTQPEDPENLTNRAPYPIFHILREASLEAALAHYPGDPEEIPERNIRRVTALSREEILRLFPHLG